MKIFITLFFTAFFIFQLEAENVIVPDFMPLLKEPLDVDSDEVKILARKALDFYNKDGERVQNLLIVDSINKAFKVLNVACDCVRIELIARLVTSCRWNERYGCIYDLKDTDLKAKLAFDINTTGPTPSFRLLDDVDQPL